MDTALIIAIIDMALTYGAPAVVGAIQQLNKDTITQEDVDALRDMIKRPEDY